MAFREEMVWGGKKVLITGGLGFIGSTLARRLCKLSAKVTVIDAMLPKAGANEANIDDIAPLMEIHRGDMRDRQLLVSLVKQAEVIFNLAGLSSHEDSMSDPISDLEMNLTAQLTLLECCRQENRDAPVVFASTRQIYGRPKYLPVDEKHPLEPTDVNGVHKLAAEQLHLLYARIYGMPITSLRLTNTYGPGMRIKDARQTFLGVWIRSVLDGKPFEVWDGAQLRDLNYVDDVVDAFLLTAEQLSTTACAYNLGSEEVVTLRQLADLLIDSNGGGSYDVKAFPEARKLIDIGGYYSDYRLIASMGWQPKVTLQQGLQQTLEYFRHHMMSYI